MKTEALQISVTDFLSRLRLNLCIINNIPLNRGDIIILKKEVENLLLNVKNENEKLLVNRIIYHLAENMTEYEKILNQKDKDKIQLFLLRVISKNKFLDEIALHVFIYLFWDNIKWIDFHEKIVPSLKLFESTCTDSSNSFCKEVSNNITDTCDIIFYEHSKQRIILCEVKHGNIDDRAVAQIQRYFRKTKQFIELGVYNNSILNVKPMLVCKDIPLKRWLTFPTYFRELLDIFTYEVDTVKNELKLINLKESIYKEQRRGVLTHINAL